MPRASSEATKLKHALRDAKTLRSVNDRLLRENAERVARLNASEKALETARQEIREWKVRFDLLLRREEPPVRVDARGKWAVEPLPYRDPQPPF